MYHLVPIYKLLHGIRGTECDIYHGDTLRNEWDWLRDDNAAKKPKCIDQARRKPHQRSVG